MSKPGVLLFVFSLCLYFLCISEDASGQNMGLKVEVGFRPRSSVGYMASMGNMFIDLNSAFDSTISGGDSDSFSSGFNQIYRISLGYRLPLQKKAVGSTQVSGGKVSLIGSIGLYMQPFEAEVVPSLAQYYGNTISKMFVNIFFSLGGIYRLSDRLAFIGQASYYQGTSETYWLRAPEVVDMVAGDTITSINGFGLTAGILMLFDSSEL